VKKVKDDFGIPAGGKILYAETKNGYTLLSYGHVKAIGLATYSKRIQPDNSVKTQIRIQFHYGEPNTFDLFLFEDDRLSFNSISLHTPACIADRYQELINGGVIASEQFIAQISEFYTKVTLAY